MAEVVTTVKTIQSNIKNIVKDWTKYSLFLGGLDVSSKSLEQYDPLRVGYARLFVVKKPPFLDKLLNQGSVNTPDKIKFNSFWHMLEYGFTGIDGLQNTNLDFEAVTGGYAGRAFEIPTVAKDDTNAITVKLYEMAGSPIREMIDLWITGIADPHTGLTHYHGVLNKDPNFNVAQSNHSAEMIYVQTDSTGKSSNIEYACLLANMVPKSVKKDHFNYESGAHPLVPVDVEFTTTKYESADINTIAKELVKKQSLLANYTYFRPSEFYDAANNTLGSNITGKAVPTISSWPTDTASRTE